MTRRFHFVHWSIRAKTVSLLLLASVAPLCLSAWLNFREEKALLLSATNDLLAARADHLADRLDVFHRRYQSLSRTISDLPVVKSLFQTPENELTAVKQRLRDALKTWPEHDSNIRGVGLIGLTGTILTATESPLIGVSVNRRSHILEALKGKEVISNVFVAQTEVGEVPTIEYLSPVYASKQDIKGLLAVWVRASALWSVMKNSNELAGSKSFAVLFDQQGIRIGHTFSDEIIFHPGGRLEPSVVEALVKEERFGSKTRELLEDVREFPEQFLRAKSANPDLGMFRGMAPVNTAWSFGVARRFEAVPWTVFYMVPEESALAQISSVMQSSIGLAAAIILIAVIGGGLYAAIMLRPISDLKVVTERVANGDFSARTVVRSHDEFGELAQRFNAMTENLAVQSHALRAARNELEARVQDRTNELYQITRDLKQEIIDRKAVEEKFRLAFESTPNAMIMSDESGRILMVNAQTENVFGYQRSELIGRQIEMLIPQRLRESHIQLRNQFFAHPASGPMGRERKLIGLRKDQTEFPVEVGLNPIHTENGLLVLSAVVDISERNRAEEKFRQAVESAPNGMVMINAAGEIVLVNAQTEKLFGYDRSELLGQKVEMLVPARFREAHPGFRVSFFANPQVRSMGVGRDLFGLRKDGTEFPVEIGLNPLTTDEGVMVLSAIVDVTERKRAEEKFRQAVESAPNGMVMIDADGRIVLVNAQTEKLFGYNRKELMGQPIEILVPEQFRAMHPEYRTKFFQSPQTRSMGVGRDLRGRRKDGSEFPVEIGLNPIETERGLLVLSAIVDITERRRAEEKFRQAVESAPNGMVMIDDKGRINLVNAQTEKMFGYSREELLGRPVEILVPARFRENHPQFRNQFFANPQVRSMGAGRDLFGLRKDGTEFPVEIGLNPLKTDDGVMVLSAIVDVTKRKNDEAALREKDRQLHLMDRRLAEIIHGMNEACFTLDRDWKFSFVNDRGITLLKHSREQMLGQAIWDVFSRLIGTPMEREYRRAMIERIPVSFEAFSPVAQRWLDIRLYPTTEGLAAFLLDIHERKLLEAERQKFVSLAENSGEFIGMCDLDGNPVFLNDAGLKLVGLESTKGIHLLDFFFDEDKELILKKFLPIVLRDGHNEMEMRFRHFKTGEPIWMLYNVFAIRDASQTIVGYATVSRDVTERRAAENEIRQLNEQLERRVAERTRELEATNKELEAFSYSVSHDLRSPLRAVNGFAQAVIEDYSSVLPEQGRRDLQIISNSAQRMGELIDDLLAFSRLSRLPLNRTAVDTFSLVNECLQELQVEQQQANYELRLEQLPPCHGDHALLKQVWLNLLNNAFKYSRKQAQPRIEIGSRTVEGDLAYFVRDNGTGFDMKYASKLFGVFQRLHRADEFEGTGVGLALVQRIVTRHNGKVWAVSQVGQGATFWFTVPEANS